MHRFLLALVAVVSLTACASTIENAYEDDQRRECERSSRNVERAMC